MLYGVAHLEQLDDNAWFLNLTRPDGTGYAVWLNTRSRKITASFEERKGPPLSRWDKATAPTEPTEQPDPLATAINRYGRTR